MLLPVPRFTLLLSTETIPGCFAEAEELPAAYNGICCEDKQMHKNRAEILSILAKIVVCCMIDPFINLYSIVKTTQFLF